MKKHGILLDMINDSITFSFGYYTYFEAFLFLISLKSKGTLLKSEGTETIPDIRQQNIFPNRILKSGSDENLVNFSRTPQKILNKTRRLINTSKWKRSIDKQ